MKVYGQPATVRRVLRDMCFLEQEIGQAGQDKHGSFVRASRPDETAIASLKTKPGIRAIRVGSREIRQVFCHRLGD